ncbi:galactokinase [Muriicola sp. E247]|uniref:galactokinase n=1 Tax=Muriicola sp. E247 TaxID=3242730 RepID=UPI00352598E7
MNQNLTQRVRSSFIEEFSTQPLMVWAPGRINIIGEHTDYNMGFVLPAAIDRGIVLALERSETEECTLVATDVKESVSFKLSGNGYEFVKGWQGYFLGILKELHKSGIKITPFNLLFSGDIPAGAGLSSSAAIENAFIFSLNALFGLELSPMEMVRISHSAEQEYVGVQCGIMDQFASMFGKENHAIFLDCHSLKSELIPLNQHEYEWLLIDTSVKHSLADSAYNQRRKSCEAVALELGTDSLREVTKEKLEQIRTLIPGKDFQKALFVLEENERVIKAVEALRKSDFKSLGRLMYESHQGLQLQYEVSCEELDFLVEITHGQDCVLGSRMMGGGFGGCTLNLIKREDCNSFLKTASNEYEKRFGKAFTSFTVNLSEGCKLIL